jgi:hypothetical protein
VPLLDQVTLRWFSRDLNSRGMLVANALSDSVAEALAERARGGCSRCSNARRRTSGWSPSACAAAATCCCAPSAFRQPRPPGPRHRHAPTRSCRWPGGSVHVGVHDVVGRGGRPAPPATADGPRSRLGTGRGRRERSPVTPAPRATADDRRPPLLVGRLVLLHDLSFIDRRSQDTRRYLIGLITALGLVIALITVVVAQLSWRGWVAACARLMRGEGLLTPWPARPRAGAAGDRAARPAARPGRRVPPLAGPRAPNGPPSGCAACCARS